MNAIRLEGGKLRVRCECGFRNAIHSSTEKSVIAVIQEQAICMRCKKRSITIKVSDCESPIVRTRVAMILTREKELREREKNRIGSIIATLEKICRENKYGKKARAQATAKINALHKTFNALRKQVARISKALQDFPPLPQQFPTTST